MAYIFCADIYCDDCGAVIRDRRTAAGLAPDDPNDERSYDSDEYPKYMSGDEEADTPQHCGNHNRCLAAKILPSGQKIGALLSTQLTEYGVQYVKDAVAWGGEIAEFWREQFDWIDFDN